MWHRIKDLWKHNRLALLAFVAVVALSGFFGVKSVSQFVYWADPQHQDQSLAGWMTPRYIGQSYQVPPEVIFEAFDLSREGPNRRISLETLAADKGLTLQDLQTQVDAAVAAWRADNPRPRE